MQLIKPIDAQLISFRIRLTAFIASSLFGTSVAFSQVGDTSNVTYPGWKSSDKVSPAITVTAGYDSTSRTYTYGYAIANETSATQGIDKIDLDFTGPTLSASAPSGWDAWLYQPIGGRSGATFSSFGDDYISSAQGLVPNPGAALIVPGTSQSSYTITSLYPPGYSRTYTRGYAGVPLLSDSSPPVIQPADTTDSQRGWTLGPTRYTTVVTQGTQEAGDLSRSNRFLVFMNVDTLGSVLRAPAVIAVKFDNTSGDLPIRASFRALLNGVDVTSLFRPGPSDGADLVAVFELGAGKPVVVGSNTLKTFVTGLPSTVGVNIYPSPVDTDTIIFTVATAP